MLLGLHGIHAELALDGGFGKHIGIIALVQHVIGNMLYDRRGFLVVDQGGGLDNEFLRIILKLVKDIRLDALKNKRVLTDPGVYLDNRRMDMDRARDRLLAASERQLAAKRQSFVKLGAALDAMSPLRVLSRGYTVSSDREGKVLKSVRDLRAGQEISVRFSDGLADCRVESITEGE